MRQSVIRELRVEIRNRIYSKMSDNSFTSSYANQGSRNSAILPFTSALSAFCAAATAAMVELPFIDAVSAAYGTIGEGE